MPGSMPATSQLDWLISTTVMIVLSWSRATRDLLKSFGWGIRALHQLATATMVPSPRRLPHTISPLEEDGFKLAVSSCETGLPGRAGMNAGSMSCAAPLSAGRPTREATAGPLAAAPGVRISLAPGESLRTIFPPRSLGRHFRDRLCDGIGNVGVGDKLGVSERDHRRSPRRR